MQYREFIQFYVNVESGLFHLTYEESEQLPQLLIDGWRIYKTLGNNEKEKRELEKLKALFGKK